MNNKKGFEMTINTLILIVLGVILLVGLIYALEKQTKFFSRTLESFSGKTNIDSLVVSCNSLATQNSLYEYCCVKKEVNLDTDKPGLEPLTCNELANKTFVNNRITEMNCEGAC